MIKAHGTPRMDLQLDLEVFTDKRRGTNYGDSGKREQSSQRFDLEGKTKGRRRRVHDTHGGRVMQQVDLGPTKVGRRYVGDGRSG